MKLSPSLWILCLLKRVTCWASKIQNYFSMLQNTTLISMRHHVGEEVGKEEISTSLSPPNNVRLREMEGILIFSWISHLAVFFISFSEIPTEKNTIDFPWLGSPKKDFILHSVFLRLCELFLHNVKFVVGEKKPCLFEMRQLCAKNATALYYFCCKN